jgi:transcriptional regulator with XRE-family HTH domain
MGSVRRVLEVEEVIDRIRMKIKPWGITVSYLAEHLGVSRQYMWQIIHYRTQLSRQKVQEIEAAVDRIIEGRTHVRTFGDRLRAARIAAGMTLKQAAAQIGYTFAASTVSEKTGLRMWCRRRAGPTLGRSRPILVWASAESSPH